MESVLVKLSNNDKSDFSKNDWGEVVQSLVELTRYCQDGENRTNLDKSIFKCLGKILTKAIESETCHDETFVEVFRFLRNAVVACKRNQDAIREESSLYKVTQRFLRIASCADKNINNTTSANQEPETFMIDAGHSENKLLAIRCSLQFLANSMVENNENTVTVVALFMEDLNSVVSILHKDEKVIQFVAMIVHLAMKKAASSLVIPPGIIQHFLQNLHLEFVVYAIESLVVLENFPDTYEILEPQARIRVLNFLNARADLIQVLNEKTISMIKLHFVEKSDFILRSKVGDSENTFCWEIAILLETLCSVSLTEKTKDIKSDPVLLTTVLCLLKQIYEAGKLNVEDWNNVFSPVEDLGKLTSKSTVNDEMDDLRAHPTFQFKAHLIRLIGNLAHRNKTIQDKVREMECLPIILDSCKIDARNPFIAQWSVLAIRNLCEGNEDNQAYIRKVQRVDTENLLPKLELVDLSN